MRAGSQAFTKPVCRSLMATLPPMAFGRPLCSDFDDFAQYFAIELLYKPHSNRKNA